MRLALLLVLGSLAGAPLAQPVALEPDIAIRRLMTAPPSVSRLALHPTTGELWMLALDGALHRSAPPYTSSVLVATSADHGVVQSTQGLAVGANGDVFFSGNVIATGTTTGIVRRGQPVDGTLQWSTVVETVPFPRNDFGPLNHLVNALALSPDGASLFINSGSRTDHGEPGPAGSTHPGVREVPLTSAILRVPATATDLVLPNDEAALRAGGYLFADGVRNTFSLAFNADGRLYGAENSGDRDDGDEINWLREGHHYGFPWRMGTNDTPQRVPGYDPADDPLLNPLADTFQLGFFHDDPTYPAPPAGVSFTDPVASIGPDADRYREASTGAIVDASDGGQTIRTLTAHSSPLGLAFDVAEALPAPFTGDGLVIRFSSGAPGEGVLFEPFGESGQDLLHLDFQTPDRVSTRRLVAGFQAPTDAVLAGRSLIVVELGGTQGIWAVDFTGTLADEPAPGGVEVRVGPNPFADQLHVAVRRARSGHTTADVFDALGRRIGGAVVADGAEVAFDASRWAPGAYVVRVRSGESVSSHVVVRR